MLNLAEEIITIPVTCKCLYKINQPNFTGHLFNQITDYITQKTSDLYYIIVEQLNQYLVHSESSVEKVHRHQTKNKHTHKVLKTPLDDDGITGRSVGARKKVSMPSNLRRIHTHKPWVALYCFRVHLYVDESWALFPLFSFFKRGACNKSAACGA